MVESYCDQIRLCSNHTLGKSNFGQITFCSNHTLVQLNFGRIALKTPNDDLNREISIPFPNSRTPNQGQTLMTSAKTSERDNFSKHFPAISHFNPKRRLKADKTLKHSQFLCSIKQNKKFHAVNSRKNLIPVRFTCIFGNRNANVSTFLRETLKLTIRIIRGSSLTQQSLSLLPLRPSFLAGDKS